MVAEEEYVVLISLIAKLAGVRAEWTETVDVFQAFNKLLEFLWIPDLWSYLSTPLFLPPPSGR